MRKFSRTVNEIAPHADWVTAMFLIIILLPVGVATVLEIIGVGQYGSLTLAWVTAITANAAIYRLRRPNRKARPAVRPAFSPANNGVDNFGLKNFGPDPALYVQIEAIDGKTGDTLFKSEPREEPVHLTEGEFVGFVHGDCAAENDMYKMLRDDVEDGDFGMMYIHFSYLSPDGQRIPGYMHGQLEREDESILDRLKENGETPRRMELSKIRDRCLIE